MTKSLNLKHPKTKMHHMKKITFLVTLLALAFQLSAFSVKPVHTDPQVKASAVMIPVGKKGQSISLLDLSVISRTDLEKMTGQKMSLPQRLAFKGAQKKLQKSIDDQGYIQSKKLQKYFSKAQQAKGGEFDGSTGFHLGGFALGFLLGLIGIIIAYIINDDKKSNRVKWSWIGFAIWVGILLIAVVL